MGRRTGKGRAVKNARRKFGAHFESEDIKLAPHTMVINRGHVEKEVKDLMLDLRKVMEPYTAASLKVKRNNTLKDFVAIAGPLHVSHLLVLSQTSLGDYLKLVRVPRGPTIHFKIVDYSLCNDVLNAQKKKHTHKKQFLFQPLLVINGFNTKSDPNDPKSATIVEPQHKLLITALQNMFPAINVTKVDLSTIKRCVLFNYNKEDKTIDFRQYYIRLMPVGLSKPVKKLVQEKLPDLSKFQDISEFIEKGALLSESEAELDGPENEVKLKKDMNMRGAINLKNSSSAIRLTEIGPRLKLKLVKIEEGVCDGEVLYHEFVTKTPEELKEIREKLKQKKNADKLKLKEKMSREKKKQEAAEKEKKDDKKKTPRYEKNDRVEYDDENDNVEYYKEELGEEPGEEFDKRGKKRKNERRRNDDYLGNEVKRIRSDVGQESHDEENFHNDNSKFSAKFEENHNKLFKTQTKAKFFRVSNKKKTNFSKSK